MIKMKEENRNIEEVLSIKEINNEIIKENKKLKIQKRII